MILRYNNITFKILFWDSRPTFNTAGKKLNYKVVENDTTIVIGKTVF